MCYRELNIITVKVNFTVPLIDDQLYRLKGKKIFIPSDLKYGFHNVCMNEATFPYRSCVTPIGQYMYLRMPFGLSNPLKKNWKKAVIEEVLEHRNYIARLNKNLARRKHNQ